MQKKETNAKFTAEYTRLRQWVESNMGKNTNGKPAQNSLSTPKPRSGSKSNKTTSSPKYKSDSRLLEFLKSPLGKFKLDPATFTPSQLKQAYKASGIKYEYEYGTVVAAGGARFSTQNPGVKLLGQDIRFCTVNLLIYATKIKYSFVFNSKDEAGQFFEKLLGTCKASGIGFGNDYPSSNFIHACKVNIDGASIGISQYVNDKGDYYSVDIESRWDRPTGLFDKITYSSPSQWVSDIFGTGLSLESSFDEIKRTG